MTLEDLVMKRERIVMINDVHVPFHDPDTWKSVMAGIRDMKPDKVIIGGDFVDFYSVSRFDKDPRRHLYLESEVGQARVLLKDLRRAVPNAQIQYFAGNHEDRLQKYINSNAGQLAWIEGLNVAGILGLDEFDISYLDRRSLVYKGVMYSHLGRVNKYGGATARNIGADTKHHVVHTHTHKVGHVSSRGQHFYDNGCLCQLDPEYMRESVPDTWTQAFMVVDYIGQKPLFQQVQIEDNKFIWNGKLYTPEGKVSLKKNE